MMPGPRDYTDATVKKLFGLSRNRCAKPDCRRVLIVPGRVPGVYGNVAKIAHIHAAYPEGARYDASMTDDERRDFRNLLLLCGYCHDQVDNKDLEDGYPAEILERWKMESENHVWVELSSVEDWGIITVGEPDERVDIPYYRADGEMLFFMDSQWKTVERTFWIYWEITELCEAQRVSRAILDSSAVGNGVANSNLAQFVRLLSSADRVPSEVLPSVEDASIYEAPASRLFSLMLGNEMTLADLAWVATNPQSRLIAKSLDEIPE